MNLINGIETIATGNVFDIVPGAGEGHSFDVFGSSVWAGGAPNGTPRMNVGMVFVDPVLGALGPANFLVNQQARGWNQKPLIRTDNLNFLRLTNPGAGGNQNLSWSGQNMYALGQSVLPVISGVTRIAIGNTFAIRPPAGESWVIDGLAFGASVWVGAAPAGYPDIQVSLTDGVHTALILDGADHRGWNSNLKLYIDNTNYLLVTNTFAGNNDVAWSGLRLTNDMVVTPVVKSDVVTVGAGLATTIRPPAGEKWLVTFWGASVWVGVAPAGLPDISVNLTDGTIASLLSRNSDYAGLNNGEGVLIDHDNYMTITDTGGAGLDIGYSAVLVEML